jgi:hypothetical protein
MESAVRDAFFPFARGPATMPGGCTVVIEDVTIP